MTQRSARIGAIGLGRIGPVLRAALVAGMLAAAAVLPAAAAGGPTSLVNPDVSPTSGTTTTTIQLAVTYRSSHGLPPDYVRVRIGDTVHDMRPSTGTQDWKKGGRFVFATKLKVGTYAVTFLAADKQRHETSLGGGSLSIGPAATPKPTPKPTSKPTPKPTPRSTPAPTPRPTARPSARPTPRPSRGPVSATPRPTPPEPSTASPDPTPRATSSPDGIAFVPGIPGSGTGGGPSGGGASGPRGGPDGAGTPGSGGGTGGNGLAPASSFLAVVAAALPAAVVTTGGVTMAMAFLVFGKRRRDQQPTAPDDVLASNAARGAGLVPNAGYATGVAANAAAVAGAVSATTAAPAAGAASEVDAHLPRWRRPSLLEARKADPNRGGGAASVTLRFTGEVSTAVEGLERRLVRYRLVSLLDVPDEVRGIEIGVLDDGDEVVMLEKRGTYWRVLCPDGRQGWLHKMTLGDVVIDPSTQGGESWTSGDGGPNAGGFEDVLRAYTDKRRQLGEA